jgi:alpha-amylase
MSLYCSVRSRIAAALRARFAHASIALLVVVVTSAGSGIQVRADTSDASTSIILQGFHWDAWREGGADGQPSWYQRVEAGLPEIEPFFDKLWLPPPSDSLAPQGYLPRELYNLNSRYGSESQLRRLIQAATDLGIQPLADIVINHRVGIHDWADFKSPEWGPWAVCCNDRWRGATGNPTSGDPYDAARNIDHSNPTVQRDISAWMTWLRHDIGFAGWRYDYVRGYWGGYVRSYNQVTAPEFAVGEYWPKTIFDYDASHPNTNYHRQSIVDWIDATGGSSSAFDYTTRWQLKLALERGEYWRLGAVPGVIGWWPGRAVTFVANHDTDGSQNHWPFPRDKVELAYAYIMTHPGIPSVPWFHWFGPERETIRKLIEIRMENAITSVSHVAVQKADHNSYAAIIDERVAMKVGPEFWSPAGSHWRLAASGRDFAVWSRLRDHERLARPRQSSRRPPARAIRQSFGR